jgi:hypothetical protein
MTTWWRLEVADDRQLPCDEWEVRYDQCYISSELPKLKEAVMELECRENP